jgi:hypothetical protein
MKYLPRPLLPTLAIAVLGPVLPAQDAQEGDPAAAARRAKMEALEGGGEWVESGSGKEEVKQPFDPNAPRAGLERQVGMVVSFRSRRIPPGGSGEMQVVLALRGDSVMTPDGVFEPRLPERIGKVRFGSWRRSEAGPATLAPAFDGQPIWDNTMVLTVDVDVDADAGHGPAAVYFMLEAQLFDAEQGNSKGVYRGQVRGQLEIGDPLPVPDVRPVAAATGRAGAAPRAGGSEIPATPAAEPREAASAALQGRRNEGRSPASEPTAAPPGAGSPEAPADDGALLLPLVGAGVILAGVLFLALRRRG